MPTRVRIWSGRSSESGETVTAETQSDGAIRHQIECSNAITPANVLVLLRVRKYLGLIRDVTRCTCAASLLSKDDCSDLLVSLRALVDNGRLQVLRRMADHERASRGRHAKLAVDRERASSRRHAWWTGPVSICFLHSARTVAWERGSGIIQLPIRLEPDTLDQVEL